jgi:CelD/BcsL family acetyltransferase involved in cellulose biosynthesis
MKTKTNSLETTKITSVADAGPYLEVWRKLAQGAPMRSPEWLLEWWKIYAEPEDELAVLLFREPEGSIIGLAPLYLKKMRGSATFRLLGSGRECTHHTTWLSATGREKQVGVEVGQFLLQNQSDWQQLLFEAIDADDIAIHATMKFLRDNGCLVNQRPLPNCWRIALPSTWDDYLMMLSSSLRKRCRKLQRQFFDSGQIQIHQAENESECHKGFDILLKLHAARWGSKQEPHGAFGDQKFRTFHETVSKSLLRHNQLRLMWLEHNGEPIAIEYQFLDKNTVYAYQAGVDQSKDDFSSGKLTMMAAIQFAIAQGCKSFDLLSGDEPYKAHWRATATARDDLRVWRGGIRNRTEWARWEMFTWAVRNLKPRINPRLIRFVRQLVPR